MWIFTTAGFVSIVQDKDDERMVLVRSRVREHLVAFTKFLHPKGARITHDKTRDYPYRIRVSKVRAAHAVFDSMLAIDYGNFKEAATKRQAKESQYVEQLHDVYWTLALPQFVERHQARASSAPYCP